MNRRGCQCWGCSCWWTQLELAVSGEERYVTTLIGHSGKYHITLSPVPELSYAYRGWTWAGERRVKNNLHANARNEPIKNYLAVVDKSSCLLASTCRAIPFSARALKKKKKHFHIVVKNIFIYVLSWSVLLSTTTMRHYSFPKHFFVLFLHVERVCKRFWKESLTRTSSSFA